MDPTHNIGKFLRLLEWFSEAHLLYPTIIKNKEVGCLLYDSFKNQILWNYDFDLFVYEIQNMNKLIIAISVRTLKLKVCLFYLKKEKLAR